MTIDFILSTNPASGGVPRSGSSVSFAVIIPERRMNTETASPHQPSSGREENPDTTVQTSTAPVAMQSLRLSAAVALIAADDIFFAIAVL